MSAAFVHPTAVIDAHVSLGEGVRVWHFVHVSEGAHVGAGTSLGQNVFVGRGVRIGARVKVQNNVSLYEGVEIADDVFLGPSCVFTNVINPRAFVERKHAYRPTHVGRGASIGANATIVCGHRIGEYALVGAHATVTRDVPAYALVVGTPARRVGWVCRCGERLPSGERVQCAACGAAYQVHAERCEPLAGGVVGAPRADAPREQHHCAAEGVKREQEGSRASTQPQSAPAPMRVPLLDLQAQNAPLMPEYRAAFERVMASGQFILGPEVERFERALCDTFGFRHAVAVSSGTDALLLALMALEIGPGDEVITTPFSFFATAGCVARLGARPVFVDIDPRTYNLDPARVAAAITARTKAIVPVHLFGQPAALDELVALAERHGVALVEDAAQALGATYRGVHVGRFGKFGCFSFFPSKNLGGFGDGGLVTTEDAALAERARILRAHGGKPKYFHALVGGNFRLDALQAALLGVKLPSLASYTARRRAHAAYYDARLADLEAQGRLRLPRRSPEAEHVFNQYVIRTPQRDALRAVLSEAQIGHEIYYPRALHLQACFAQLGYSEGDLPEAERACNEVLAIPVYAELSEAQRAYVADTLVRFFER